MTQINKLVLVVATLLIGWSAMIWMQWNGELSTVANLLGMPVAMLTMALLAVFAVKGDEV